MMQEMPRSSNGIAEGGVMASAGEQGAQFAAHQAGAQNSNAHGSFLSQAAGGMDLEAISALQSPFAVPIR
jgi:hypothetical protein